MKETNIKQADLALEPIPFPDNEFDLVGAYDFMEHIPPLLYLFNPKTGKSERRSCMVELFNEIYRVLKNNGEFYFQSPCYPHRAVFQDPTHVYFWTEESINYFSGDYYGFQKHYGHTSNFEKVSAEVKDSHICVTLKATK